MEDVWTEVEEVLILESRRRVESMRRGSHSVGSFIPPTIHHPVSMMRKCTCKGIQY